MPRIYLILVLPLAISFFQCINFYLFESDYTSRLAISSFLPQVGVFQCCFVLAVELVGPSWRVFCGVVIEFFFVGGELLLAVLAWWLRYKRTKEFLA